MKKFSHKSYAMTVMIAMAASAAREDESWRIDFV
jgi:hypothetical protein